MFVCVGLDSCWGVIISLFVLILALKTEICLLLNVLPMLGFDLGFVVLCCLCC